jgi:hypothetical protein
LANRRWGPTYIAVHTQRMELWVDFFEVLRLLMCGGRASRSFSLAKEASAAAFCSLPPSTLGLRHRLRLRPGNAVAPGGGRSFYSCICPSNWPLEESSTVSYVCLVGSSGDGLRLRLRLVPGRTRPSSGGAFALRLIAIGRDCGFEWGRSSSSSTTGGGRLRHQVVATGVA